MAIKARHVLTLFTVFLLWAAGWLLQLGQAQGTFDDDDPSNDPNTCYSDPDPANCNWDRGWHQAAVNAGHMSLNEARSVYHDMAATAQPAGGGGVAQPTNNVVASPNPGSSSEYSEQASLYDDGVPSNDPNLCFTSTDPDCDWEQGWLDARATIIPSTPISATDEPSSQDYGVREGDRLIGDKVIRGTAPAGWLTAIANETVPPNVTVIRWLGPPTETDEP